MADAAASGTYLLIDFYKDLWSIVEIVSRPGKAINVTGNFRDALLHLCDWNVNLEGSLFPVFKGSS